MLASGKYTTYKQLPRRTSPGTLLLLRRTRHLREVDGALPPHDHAEADDAMRGAPRGLGRDAPRLSEGAKRVRDEARRLVEDGGDDAVIHRERDCERAFSGEKLCGSKAWISVQCEWGWA